MVESFLNNPIEVGGGLLIAAIILIVVINLGGK